MSEKSRLRQRAGAWKTKAVQRANDFRYLKKENSRIKGERDQIKNELKETRARVRLLEAQGQTVVIQDKVDLVYLALQLFSVAHIGFRAVSRVLGVVAGAFGIKKKIPCPQTIINWVTRLSLVRIRAAAMLKGSPMSLAPSCNGLIWMIDMSIALGTGKILVVLACDAHHHQDVPSAPGLQNVHCVAVAVAASWTGETIAAFLQRVIAVVGRPAAYLKDAGADLQKAIRLLGEQGLASQSIDDISHAVANLLKRRYLDDPSFEIFVSACGRVSANLKQTILACLMPPKVRTKARFMNVHRLILWAEKMLKLSPAGGAVRGSSLSKLRACLDHLPACKKFIQRFRDDAAPMMECEKILKTQGLSYDTLAKCAPIIETIGSASVAHGFTTYLKSQLEIAITLGLEEIGMTISSDQVESLFGVGKQHGAGEIKDAARIATRIPALCGAPNRAEAQKVLGITVAEQQEIIGRLPSLTKQRRDVLSNPDRLEGLSALNEGGAHLELIPRAENRSNSREIIDLSNSCGEMRGPEPPGRMLCASP